VKIYYSDAHRAHDIPFEIGEGGERLPMDERPDRLDGILEALRQAEWAEILPPQEFGLGPVLAVHDRDYADYLRTAWDDWQRAEPSPGWAKPGATLYPATFPPRRGLRRPATVTGLAGYYLADLSAPLGAGTYRAALSAVACALSGAQAILAGERAAFAMCRPPGHHAGRDYAAGYCYLNNAAIAARRLLAAGKAAILDIDYHAANGTQDIFYDSPEVLTVSLHADPARRYPYFSGYADEHGARAGAGFHHNFPLPPGTGDDEYLRALGPAMELVRGHAPAALILSAGLDTLAGDPQGDFTLTLDGVAQIGRQVAELGLPVLAVLEGGYHKALGEGVLRLLSPLAEGRAA
jgi:acetoin utilization deacetylase AcuC-like enzyme